MSFSGLNILFIGIGFYDYEYAIAERLEQRGSYVDYWADTPSILRKKPWGGVIFRIPFLVRYLQKKHENKILSRVNSKKYDKVFFIKGVDISESFIIKLRENQCDSDFILYEWDSIKRNPILFDRFKYFDYIYSFDREDSINHSFIKFRPLFFRCEKMKDDKVYDIAFIGLMHSSRLEVVREIQKQAERLNIRIYVYMTTGILSWLRFLIKGDIKNLHVNNMSYQRVLEVNRKSHCVLDLPHPDQTGLTMRAIEALGLDMKIITTSTGIRSYDFFNESMINIIDINAPKLNKSFILSSSRLDSSFNNKIRYSLDYWLDEIFSMK
ncbi:CgeB family protein [Pectobacterium versatile]|uniref:hypothetical protein n=1 Tax=Pectobacterium versatile TaxID=2488639 RepID=UPI001F29A20C|nr:hypothetical protein [Pectobacterium versatile]